MRKIVECTNYFVFDNEKEFLEKVDIDKLRESGILDEYPYYGWAEHIEEDFETILRYFGFTNIELCWDLSYSQGSGASFAGEWCIEDMNLKALKDYVPDDKDLHKMAGWLEDLISESTMDCECFEYDNPEEECGSLAEYYKNKEECEENMKLYSAHVKRFNHYYCHQNTVESECYDAEGSRREDLDVYFDDIVQELETWFYNRLESEYDYLISDEGIAEYFVNNEISVEEKYLKEEYRDESTTNN